MRRSEAETSFFNQAAVQQSCQRMSLAPFLMLTLFFPGAIVFGNFVLGALAPITWAPEDDMMLIDPVWRLVQGQHLGTDFHNPIGFGLFEVAAVVWRLRGPHYYVLRAAVDLFALVVVLCGCFVAIRRLRHVAGLGALFCITVACVASAPSIYGLPADFGISLTYDRLLMAGLAVLFVQSFANDPDFHQKRFYIDLCFAAFLLNILFMVKISGLIVGLTIVAGGLITRDGPKRSLLNFSLILLLLAIMLTIDFVIMGTDPFPVFREYWLAAQGRMGSYSVRDVVWFASRLPIFWMVALMVLYAVSQPDPESSVTLWRCFFIIGFYWVCQVVLNMSNGTISPAHLFLAPAAVVVLVTWTDASNASAFWDRLWTRFHFRGLHLISARNVIPLLVLLLIITPEALASLRAVKLIYSISSGAVKPIAVTAHKGIAFDIMPKNSYNTRLALSFNRAIEAIDGLGANGVTIANLDFMNPFPALFLAPAPKGVSVYWDFRSNFSNVPIGYRPSWQEIIGDACIVTEEKNPELPAADYSGTLVDVMRPHLASAFTLVYQDELWRIWKSRSGCGVVDGESPNRSR